MASGNRGVLINADQKGITALLLISLSHLPDRHRCEARRGSPGKAQVTSGFHNANWQTAASVQNGGSQEGPNHAGLSTGTSVGAVHRVEGKILRLV